MNIDLKKIFQVLSPRNSIIDNVKIIRSTNRLKTLSLQIRNGVPVIYCPLYIKDSYLRSIIKKNDRSYAGKTAPSKGLFFLGPTYSENFAIDSLELDIFNRLKS